MSSFNSALAISEIDTEGAILLRHVFLGIFSVDLSSVRLTNTEQLIHAKDIYAVATG